jgi:hypothetical protein
MSLEPPTYLSSLQNNIRARPIPWEGAVRVGNITDDQLRKIKAVDKVRKEQRRQTVENDLDGYTNLLAGGANGKSVLESASKRTDIVHYILVLAADLINGTGDVLTRGKTVEKLIIHCQRCSLTGLGAGTTSRSLQAVLTPLAALYEPRRSNPSLDLRFSYKSHFNRACLLIEGVRKRGGGPPRALLISVVLDEESR